MIPYPEHNPMEQSLSRIMGPQDPQIAKDMALQAKEMARLQMASPQQAQPVAEGASLAPAEMAAQMGPPQVPMVVKQAALDQILQDEMKNMLFGGVGT